MLIGNLGKRISVSLDYSSSSPKLEPPTPTPTPTPPAMASSQFLQFIDQNAQKFIGRLAEAVAIPRSVARKTESVQD